MCHRCVNAALSLITVCAVFGAPEITMQSYVGFLAEGASHHAHTQKLDVPTVHSPNTRLRTLTPAVLLPLLLLKTVLFPINMVLCPCAKVLYAATALVSMFHCAKELQHVHGAAHWRLQRWAEETAYPQLIETEAGANEVTSKQLQQS